MTKQLCALHLVDHQLLLCNAVLCMLEVIAVAVCAMAIHEQHS